MKKSWRVLSLFGEKVQNGKEAGMKKRNASLPELQSRRYQLKRFRTVI